MERVEEREGEQKQHPTLSCTARNVDTLKNHSKFIVNESMKIFYKQICVRVNVNKVNNDYAMLKEYEKKIA